MHQIVKVINLYYSIVSSLRLPCVYKVARSYFALPNAGVVCPVIGSLIEKVAAPGLAFVWTVLDSDDMDGTSEEDLLLANALRAMSTKGNPMPRFAL